MNNNNKKLFGHSPKMRRRSVDIPFVNASARAWTTTTYYDASRCGRTHPKPRVSLDTERKRRRTTSSPRRTRVYTREETRESSWRERNASWRELWTCDEDKWPGSDWTRDVVFFFCCLSVDHTHFVVVIITSMITNSDRLSEWSRMDSMPSER